MAPRKSKTDSKLYLTLCLIPLSETFEKPGDLHHPQKKDNGVLCETIEIGNVASWSAILHSFSGYPVVEAKRPQRQLLERFSASFAFAAKRDVAGSKKMYERE